MHSDIKRLIRTSAWLSITALASGLATAAYAQDASPQPAINTGVADIIVTANRRAEPNQTVPIAITALSPERLQQQNIKSGQDLQASIPSLTVGSVGQSSRETQSFTLRGQGATYQASPGVVVYFNEMPLPSPTTLSQQGGPGNYVDLENLQVLAGPQGTLFGRNTTGGAILLVPKKPTNELGGYVQGTIGNYQDRELEGVLNVPVVDDKIMIRAVGTYRDRDGFTRDVVWDKDRDNIHYYTGRLGILMKPTERLEIYTLAYFANSHNNGTGLIHKAYNLTGLAGYHFCASASACTPYSTADALAAALGPRKTAMDIDEYQSTKTWGIENTTKYELSDNLTIRNLFSYQRFKSHYLADADATILQQYESDPTRLPSGAVSVGVGSNVLGPYTYHNQSPDMPRDNISDITEELQLQGTGLDQHLTYTVGGFYYDQKPHGTTGNYSMNFCPAASTGLCAYTTQFSATRNRSKALYAQAVLDLGVLSPALERLKLTGGYRYTWDHITGSNTSTKLGTGANLGKYVCSSTNAVVADPSSCTYTGNLRSKAPNWLIGLDYRVNDRLLVYGKISHGYKAGGFNGNSVRPDTRTFEPEYATTYEAGFKSDFRLAGIPSRLNASYYYTNYSNIQKAVGDFNPTTRASGAAVLAASARIQGVEVEATVKPAHWLEIGGNFSYTDAHYKKYQFTAGSATLSCDGNMKAAGQTVDLGCLPVNYIAPYIYSVHAAVNVPAPGNLGTLAFFVNYSHTAAQHTSGGTLNEPGEKFAAYGLLNASLDLKGVAGTGLDLGLFVTNATNKLYRIGNSNVYGSLMSWSTTYGEPRMYGVRLRYSFGN